MDDADSPFHEGERTLQARVGARERVEAVGQRTIRDHMPDEHRELFEKLPMLLVGAVDREGRPWASIVHGAAGFVRSPDPQRLTVAALPHRDDPVHEALQVGAKVGLLAIELETRRRNRMNGRVTARSPEGFTVSVQQSYGNCPKYIHTRRHHRVERAPQRTVQQGPGLSPPARALIERADTCFIASASPRASTSAEPRDGVDVSHRGGRPGFIGIGENAGAVQLSMPDYVGNNLFNTLGNLLRHPFAGLLFVDFDRGDLLSLRCVATVDWDSDELETVPGALRLVHLTVEAGVFFPAALPFRWSS